MRVGIALADYLGVRVAVTAVVAGLFVRGAVSFRAGLRVRTGRAVSGLRAVLATGHYVGQGVCRRAVGAGLDVRGR